MADVDEDAFELADLIRDIGHGATNRLGSARLTEMLKACQATGLSGRITLDIAMRAGPDGIADISVKIKTSKPEAKLPGGAYYVTAAGGLVTEDPKQLKLPAARVLPDAKIVNINNGGK